MANKVKVGKKKGSIEAPLLSRDEMLILKHVREGLSNEEIGLKLVMTKGSVGYRLSNIMKRLGVRTRSGVVKKAVDMGLVPEKDIVVERGPRVKVGIVGGGKGCLSLLDIFMDNPMMGVTWVSDRVPDAPGIKRAKKLEIPVSKDFRKFVKKGADVVINVTGSSSVLKDIEAVFPSNTEIIGGLSAKLIWQLVEERGRLLKGREGALKGHEELYKLGLVIESSDNIKDAGDAIVEYATRLTDSPAGSLAIFDERRGEDMYLVAAKGFSRSFNKEVQWKIRKGGLTGYIFNQDGPVIVPDLTKSPSLNPVLIKEGVKSLLAAPLTVEKRIVGILYVNDFKTRSFTEEQLSVFSLLTIYAALAIERVKTLEQARLLSITDGLTGLYNHRYLMDRIQREIERATRHKRPMSIIMLDIDRFKGYNDKFGHLDGNTVLKNISKILLMNTRVSDTVARFGGEEFSIILPEIGKAGAVAFAKRLLKSVSGYAMPNKKVTISGGVSTFPVDGKNHLVLFKKADDRLYRAKKEGRNRVCQ